MKKQVTFKIELKQLILENEEVNIIFEIDGKPIKTLKINRRIYVKEWGIKKRSRRN